MSVKIDTILEKASVYEKLAVYGDRQTFLRALAQASLPNVQTLIAAIDAARKNAIASLTQFWTQNPNNFPMAARTAYSALRYPQTDIKTAAGEQLTSAMDQLSVALTTIYSTLMAGDQKSKDFAQQTVYPLLDNLQQKITQYKAAAESFPSVQPEGEGSGTLNVPEVTIPGQAPTKGVQVDPATLKAIQEFINNEMVVQRQIAVPIIPDGKWGPETATLLWQWGDVNNLPTNNLQSLIDIVKAKVTGNQVANSVAPGANFDQANKTQ
jgi:hypothetical protein